ncbi:MAG: DNA repair protein RadC [Sphingobacteriaceae bacterium]|nr:DNA repair protein RadC [Sphingobacteriaceae bacterium]
MNALEQRITLKFLAEADRPREKMANKGRAYLSDAELLAILLGSGNKKETAVQLAQRILSDQENNINKLAKLDINALKKYNGVGEAKAIHIVAAFELGRRRIGLDTDPIQKIQSSKNAYDILKKYLSDLPHEEFYVLYLNRANQIIKEESISKGGVSGTVVDIKIICKKALELYATGIIMAHNHPSGQLQPSSEDKHITKKIKEALTLFEIQLLDHLIIGDQNYLSFNDEGIL